MWYSLENGSILPINNASCTLPNTKHTFLGRRQCFGLGSSFCPYWSHCRLRLLLTWRTYFSSPVMRFLELMGMRSISNENFRISANWQQSLTYVFAFLSWFGVRSCRSQTTSFETNWNCLKWYTTADWEHLTLLAAAQVVKSARLIITINAIFKLVI